MVKAGRTRELERGDNEPIQRYTINPLMSTELW
jgi:hypothetical protein